jgi:adenine-specific DNA-methyltransferase
LQETMLATYRKGGRARKATVHHLIVSGDMAAITQAGVFELPADASRPWLLPRQPENKVLVSRLTAMPTRFADWGYTISTGPLVWNRYKDQLRSRPAKGAVPLIWAEAVAGPGRFIYRAEKRNHEPFFKLQDADDWLLTTKPCVLIQRTTAKEQSRRLIAAALPAELIAAHGAVVVENHLNMVRPLNGKPKVSPEVVAAILNSQIADRAFRCISGSVAVSAFELEALPLPPVEGAAAIDKLLRKGASAEAIESALQALYMGEVH